LRTLSCSFSSPAHHVVDVAIKTINYEELENLENSGSGIRSAWKKAEREE
jgi:hypothetical protein